MSENTNMNNENYVDAKEFEVAEREANKSTNVYVHTFENPFTFEEKTYKTLTFDWGKLSGNDYLSIEAEIAAKGKIVIAAEFSGDFLVGMAARACTSAIGSDFICALPLRDFNKIRGRARSFLMNTAS